MRSRARGLRGCADAHIDGACRGPHLLSKERLYEYAAGQDHPVELDPVELKRAHIRFNRERSHDMGFTDPAKPPRDDDLCITVKNAYRFMYAPAQVVR